jgi:hypothetical protein
MAMIAITTSSSMRVKPFVRLMFFSSLRKIASGCVVG